ncbi:MAG: cytochrome ubiquinol oxidase subunit I [Candidatus Melainabacteria bacterium]|nr:cytochrome ubiquinol oxidase subunit I [Candidatus Melainabacteria bacterium]
MDVTLLARIQFALTIAFHYIFPPLSIGLGVLLVIMEGLYLKTGNPLYHRMTRFWVSVFALIFGIGVATGLVMEFQFGTNWATYSRYVGDIFGSALAAEGLFAFFLESGFLAILVFGWNKVGKGLHFFSTLMVALGSMFSAVWIVVANSWMQTPAGFHIVSNHGVARAEVTDFWAMVLNPSSLDRLSHVLSGAWLAGATLVLSVSAYYYLKNRHLDFAKAGVKIALGFLAVACCTQLLSGHSSAMLVAKYQPAKLAALEGHFHTGPADLYLMGVVDEPGKRVLGLKIPGGLGLLLSANPQQVVPGLDRFPPEEQPPVQVPFQAYHLMIAIGMGLIGLATLGLFFWWRGTLFEQRWLLWAMVLSVLGPQVANQAGWIAAEVGRQPWIVYGLLKTKDAVSRAVGAEQVLGSIVLFSGIYLLLFVLFLYLLTQKIRKGPQDEAASKIHPPEAAGAFNPAMKNRPLLTGLNTATERTD